MGTGKTASQFAAATLDAPLLIRVLEYTREDLSKIEGEDGDLMLHFLADELLNQEGTLSMDRYNDIIEASRHRFVTSQGVLSDLFYPTEPKEDLVSSEKTASLEYEGVKAYAKLQNYGAALLVNGIIPYSAFVKEIKSRPYLSETLLQEAMEQMHWDESQVLHKVYEHSKAKIKDYRKAYKLPGVVEKAVELFHRGEGGSSWYSDAYKALVEVFGSDAGLMADFIASTSPGLDPGQNLLYALKAYQQYKSGQEFSDVGGHYGDQAVIPNLRRAVLGQPLSGLKVWNFSQALKGNPNAVVIDMWMARIFLGKSQVKSDGEYLFVEQLVREVAHKVNKPAADVTEADVVTLGKMGAFNDYPDIQARLWYGVNKSPKSYPEYMHQRIQEHSQTNPEFWAPYLDKTTHLSPRAGSETQLFAIYGTKDSGIEYPLTGPMPQSEATNFLTKNWDAWTQQEYENLHVAPYSSFSDAHTGTKRSRPMFYPSPKPKTSSRTFKSDRITPVIEKETEEEQRTHGHYYPGLVLVYKGLRIPLKAGTRDIIEVFEEQDTLYVLAVNTRLPYIGLDSYDSATGEETGYIFLQDEWTIVAALGEDWEDLSSEDVVKHLQEYMY